MALTEKSNQDGTFSSGPTSLRIPEKIPTIPQSMVDKFPELRQYNQQLEEWWYSLKTTLVEDFDRLNDQIDNIIS